MAETSGRASNREGYIYREHLPSALVNLQEILQQGRGKRLAIFLDYDGTLAPIAPTPDMADLDPKMHRAVVKLAANCTVGVLSGRNLEDVRRRVNVDNIFYAGCHGFVISGPGQHRENQRGLEFRPLLEQVHQELSQELAQVKGVIVEKKKFVITIHFRLVAEGEWQRVEAAATGAVSRHPQLRISHGKMMWELIPDIDWDKGKALLSILEMLKADGPEVLPFYLGDDVTDEDAFQALQGRGIGILVGEQNGPSAAQYQLKDTGEVMEFLFEITPFCRSGETR